MSAIADKIITIILTGGVLAFIEFLIKRHDERSDKKDGVKATLTAIKTELADLKTYIDKEFKKSEKDALRTQLLVMIYFQPTEKTSILTAGERYFKVLKGDWYLTSVFNRWLKDNDVAEPEWFNYKE